MIKVKGAYRELYTTSKPIILLTGGRGSGKSFAVATFCERLSFEAGHMILFTRYTMTSAGLSIIPEFVQKIRLEGTERYFELAKKEIKNKYSGSQIWFSGIKTSSGNQTAHLKSIAGLTTFVGDEMEEWVSEEDFDTMRLSIREKGVKNRVVLVMNPTDAHHFLYRKYIKKTHKRIEIDGVAVQISTHPEVCHIHTSYLDNLEHLSESFLNEVALIKKDNPSKYAHRIIGQWKDKAEGVIFENWQEGAFDENLPYCYGQDYGFSVDPTTLIKVALDEKRKKIYLHECFYIRRGLGTAEIAQLNKAYIDGPEDLIVGDSAEERLVRDLRKEGLNMVSSEKGPGSVTAGLSALQDYSIVVTPESHHAKEELNNYIWNDKKAGLPVDDYNHIIDPLRYAFKRLTSKPKVFSTRFNAEELGIF